jgi:hypothetical protein
MKLMKAFKALKHEEGLMWAKQVHKLLSDRFKGNLESFPCLSTAAPLPPLILAPKSLPLGECHICGSA